MSVPTILAPSTQKYNSTKDYIAKFTHTSTQSLVHCVGQAHVGVLIFIPPEVEGEAVIPKTRGLLSGGVLRYQSCTPAEDKKEVTVGRKIEELESYEPSLGTILVQCHYLHKGTNLEARALRRARSREIGNPRLAASHPSADTKLDTPSLVAHHSCHRSCSPA